MPTWLTPRWRPTTPDCRTEKLETVGLAIPPEPYGIGVRKDSPELKAALEDALQKVMASGKYDEILKTWGLEGGAIE